MIHGLLLGAHLYMNARRYHEPSDESTQRGRTADTKTKQFSPKFEICSSGKRRREKNERQLVLTGFTFLVMPGTYCALIRVSGRANTS